MRGGQGSREHDLQRSPQADRRHHELGAAAKDDQLRTWDLVAVRRPRFESACSGRPVIVSPGHGHGGFHARTALGQGVHVDSRIERHVQSSWVVLDSTGIGEGKSFLAGIEPRRFPRRWRVALNASRDEVGVEPQWRISETRQPDQTAWRIVEIPLHRGEDAC